MDLPTHPETEVDPQYVGELQKLLRFNPFVDLMRALRARTPSAPLPSEEMHVVAQASMKRQGYQECLDDIITLCFPGKPDALDELIRAATDPRD